MQLIELLVIGQIFDRLNRIFSSFWTIASL